MKDFEEIVEMACENGEMIEVTIGYQAGDPDVGIYGGWFWDVDGVGEICESRDAALLEAQDYVAGIVTDDEEEEESDDEDSN